MTVQRTDSGRLKVAVLMGGSSSERPISLSTGRMIVKALDPARYTVTAIDTLEIGALGAGSGAAAIEAQAPDGASAGTSEPASEGESARGMALQPVRAHALGTALASNGSRPDVVFIALHGKGGEDGSIQGLLELIGIPYTGSGVLASALAMDKAMSKQLFQANGIPTIPDVQVTRDDATDAAGLIDLVCSKLGEFPVFVKPNAEGSTFGCTLVRRPDRLFEAVQTALTFDDRALIEKYVTGVEITVGVLETPGNARSVQALAPIEIVPKSEYYDYESKYADGGSDHIIPARLPTPVLVRAQELAVRCHQVLGCRGMSRTDIIVSGDRLSVLEVNTIPGMTPTSLLPQAADHAGIAFPALLDRLIACAQERSNA
jgi:D-alanine-D-alanine ligase